MLPLGKGIWDLSVWFLNTSCETTIISLMSRCRVMAPRRRCSARSPQGTERELCLLTRVSLLLFFPCFQDMTRVFLGFDAFIVSCDLVTHPLQSQLIVWKVRSHHGQQVPLCLGYQALRSTNIRVTIPALWNWRWPALVFTLSPFAWYQSRAGSLV